MVMMTLILSKQKCKKKVTMLSIENAWALQIYIPKWTILDTCLHRSFKFEDFIKALEFVNKIGKMTEKEGHYPDIEFGWGYVNIDITTPSINGINMNDFIIAAKIDDIVKLDAPPEEDYL